MTAPTSKNSHDGKYYKYTPVADALSGDVIQIVDHATAGRIGVFTQDYLTGVQGSLLVKGVVEFDFTDAESLAFGAVAYWNAATKKITSVNTECYAGITEEVIGTGTGRKIRVDINVR